MTVASDPPPQPPGAAGDDLALPDLALCLRDPMLQDAAHGAMWNIFTRSRWTAGGRDAREEALRLLCVYQCACAVLAA